MRPAKVFGLVLFSVLLGSGCATPQPSCCGRMFAARDDHPRELIVLGDDLEPLRQAFNAQSGRWRVISLVSPTCSECVLGAEAVEKEITRGYPADQVVSIVVWIPMLESDNETAARASATIFPVGRSAQFYDARQSVGWVYSRKTFSGFIERAIKSLPPGHPLSELLNDRSEADRPQWDLYMLYPPGVQWESTPGGPPLASHWIRHCGRMDGQRSIFWRDTPDEPPREEDLFEAMREMAEQAIGENASETALQSSNWRKGTGTSQTAVHGIHSSVRLEACPFFATDSWTGSTSDVAGGRPPYS